MTSRVLDPLQTSRQIDAVYRRYLLSTFRPRRADLAHELEEALNEDRNRLSRGPFLQATPGFVPGARIDELIAEGVFSPLMERLPRAMRTRPLYLHQEQAIRKAVEGRNLVVATGTGSGKTESFMLPMLNGLLREQEAGTLKQPGVRALLLYPMNALANDQVKRLRHLLIDFPEVTFGRYIGETQNKLSNARNDFRNRFPGEPMLDNELISRDQMQESPPSILLTNYAMLEYLLLRPTDSAFFDGPTSEHWRHIVLDEAHVYGGAQGAEVAMLLRRVKDRVVESRSGAIQTFATSATLGAGRDDYPALISFAETLFGERFEWDDQDTTRQDIVEASRLPLNVGESKFRLPREALIALAQQRRDAASAEELKALVGPEVESPSSELSVNAWLYELLRHEERIVSIQQLLRAEGRPVDELVGLAGSEEELVAAVDLAVAARPSPDSSPLLPARYHHFVRALEAAQICLHPDHEDEPRLQLTRSRQCRACEGDGLASQSFELGVCRNCRAEYVVGIIRDGHPVKSAPPIAQDLGYLLITEAEDSDNDDEVALKGTSSMTLVEGQLCVGCGRFSSDGSCTCRERVAKVNVTWVDPGEGEALHRCVVCNHRSAGDVVTRFVSGADAPASVLATAIYQALPPSSDPNQSLEPGEGRKLLSFSDSRQDAAFFAPFLERTYRRSVLRRLLHSSILDGVQPDDSQCSADEIATSVRRGSEKSLVLDEDETRSANMRQATSWVLGEVMAIDRRLSLEGTGLAEISMAVPRKYRTPQFLTALGFSDEESLNLILTLLNTVRLQGAVETPDGVDIRDEQFAPRNREISVRLEGPSRGVVSWLPGAGKNRRLDVLERIFASKGIPADPTEVLRELWNYLTDESSPWGNKTCWSRASLKSDGLVHRLSWERVRFEAARPDHLPVRCDRCRQLWWRTVADVCPGWRCEGTTSPVESLELLLADHYAALYTQLEPTAMSVREHTAQWSAQAAGDIQNQFTDGKVNVLSCSTTFELGVDVGDVQAVLLKNVPPSPANYVQRAGRAGRRLDSAALVVTYAQRRSHDLTYFNRPGSLVNGVVEPPVIRIENGSIVRRHMHSLAFAAFLRDVAGEDLLDVASFFLDNGSSERADEQFVNWLNQSPAAVGEALRRVVPEGVQALLGVDSWDWVRALTEESEEDPTHGWLHRAGFEARDDYDNLTELYDAAHEEHNHRAAVSLDKMRNTVRRQQLIQYLSKKNVLPKYGFPVDVVDLNVAGSGSDAANSVELQRDLKLAIGEYAPGARVVAGGRLWASEGLRLREGMELLRYGWAVCGDCGAFRHRISQEAEESCPQCGSTGTAQGARGQFVVPMFGFIGTQDGEPGATRPRSEARVQSFFGAYKDGEPEFEELGLGGAAPCGVRTSRQGRIAVINRGRRGGFDICQWCGRAEVGGGKRKKSHKHLTRPGRDCSGPIRRLQLGHEYLTDTIEILTGTMPVAPVLMSTMYALIEGAAAIGIPRSDLDGTLRAVGSQRHSIVIFDSVPGGAGHAQRIGERLKDVVEAAYERVANCQDCNDDSSCYSCLRSYSNQINHDELRRSHAIEMLELLLGVSEAGDPLGLDLIDESAHTLVRKLAERDAPPPVIGYELPGRLSPIELAWPAAKIGVVVGPDDERDELLRSKGWHFGQPEEMDAEDIFRRLGG